jgi:hypothetical protein
MYIDPWKPWFYAGPYVPSGVIYGKVGSPNYCHMYVPGFDVDPPIHKIDLYDKEIGGRYDCEDCIR